MTEHWRAVPDDDRPDMFWNVVTDKGVCIATEMTEEDAMLLAAAPDLYEGLKHAIAIIDKYVPVEALGMNGFGDGVHEQSWPLLDEYTHHMRAALAKSRPDVAGGSRGK